MTFPSERTLTWPKQKVRLSIYRGVTYVSLGDLLNYLRKVETEDNTARQTLDGLRGQLESLL